MPDRLTVGLRVVAPAALACSLIVAAAGAAGAHVLLDAEDHHPGARDVALVMSIQGEYPDGSLHGTGPGVPTTRIVLTWPAATPVVGLTAPRFDGWSTAVGRDADGSTTVTWTGGSLAAGRSLFFPLHADALPSAPAVDATVEQDYADGRVVRWDEPPGDDPFVTPAHLEAYLRLDGTVTANFPVPVDPLAARPDSGGSGTAYAAGGGVAAVAVAAAAALLIRRRRRPPPETACGRS